MSTQTPVHRRVELIIVLLVIAGLAAYSIPRFFKARVVARDDTCHRNIVEIEKAVEVYQLAYDESLPPSLEALYGAGTMLVCPFDGRYSLKAGKVVCDHEAR
jgi:competence protein ComGC